MVDLVFLGLLKNIYRSLHSFVHFTKSYFLFYFSLRHGVSNIFVFSFLFYFTYLFDLLLWFLLFYLKGTLIIYLLDNLIWNLLFLLYLSTIRCFKTDILFQSWLRNCIGYIYLFFGLNILNWPTVFWKFWRSYLPYIFWCWLQ